MNKSAIRAETAILVNDYLARGGTITVYPFGSFSDDDTIRKPSFWFGRRRRIADQRFEGIGVIEKHESSIIEVGANHTLDVVEYMERVERAATAHASFA